MSYLPEFWAKSESEARPLLRSFCVCSLSDFVGSLPDELLLCPVRALRCYLSRTSSLPSRPRSLFVSPRAPSCPLSKNALSFFIWDVIAESYSSAGLPLPLVLGLRCVCMGFVGSRLCGLFFVTLPCLLSWRPLHGLRPLSLPPSTFLMYSSLLLRGLLWVRWWLRELWFRGLFVPCCLDRLSSCFSLLLQLGVNVLGGNILPFLACFSVGSSLSAVMPLGLRVALTPLYGSCRPWVKVTFPSVVVGVSHAGAVMHMCSGCTHSPLW